MRGSKAGAEKLKAERGAVGGKKRGQGRELGSPWARQPRAVKGEGENLVQVRGSGDRPRTWGWNQLGVHLRSGKLRCSKRHTCPCLSLRFLVGLFPSESQADKGSRARKILMNNRNWVGTLSSCLLPKSRV